MGSTWLMALASAPHLNSHPAPTVGLVPIPLLLMDWQVCAYAGKQKATSKSRVLAAILQVTHLRLMAFPAIVTWEGTATRLRAGGMP